MNTTYERLCGILVAYHKLPPESLSPDAPLETLGIDSLGRVELLWNVEDAFDIRLPSEPVDLPTLGHITGYIDELMAGPAVRQPTASVAEATSLQTT